MSLPDAVAKKRIVLAAVDASTMREQVAQQAATLALSMDGAGLHLVHVIDTLPTMVGLGSSPYLASSHARPLQQVWSELGHLLVAAERRGLSTTGHVALGHPLRKILQLTADLEADVLVIGTHDPGKLEHLLFGSVAEELVRKAPCPVFVVRPKRLAHPAVPDLLPPCSA